MIIEVPKRAFDAKVMFQSIRLLSALGRMAEKTRPLMLAEVEMTRLLGIFDRNHYLSQVDPSALGGMSPLYHYVWQGDAAGYSPSPLFDNRHYDAHCGPRGGINRLLHFGLIAHFKGVSPSPWFDPEYYLRNNPDVKGAAIEAVAHFQRWGWREGRNPLPGLDMRRILGSKSELRLVKGNPLSLFGSDWMMRHMQGLHTLSDTDALPSVQTLEADDADMLAPDRWADVQVRQWPTEPTIDVVIPVYAGLHETLRCVHRVLTAPVTTPHRVVVFNDASPVAELSAMLRSLAARDLITLEQHRINKGFVRTVNQGLRLSPERDVVILNSDTEVYGDWLDRLVAQMQGNPRLASLTPLSNNATICSYPETLSENRLPLEVTPEEIDQLAARANRGRHVVAPTGVGFCMYIRRTALNQTGYLDERRFGRGYGEENDLCQRFIRHGWTNGIACDVYVRHVGSVSFKSEAAERIEKAQTVLARLHPHYRSDVDRFIADDPVWLYRARIDLARLQRLRAERNVLLVCHSRGGGTERHLLEQAHELASKGMGVFELRPLQQSNRVSLLHPGVFGLQNLASLPMSETGMLAECLETLNIGQIHIHHLIDFPPESARTLVALSRRLRIRLHLSVHDYHLICPRVNLVNAEGRYCGGPDIKRCTDCLAVDGMGAKVGPIQSWWESSESLVAAAHRAIVPSGDTARRLAFIAGRGRLDICPHEAEPPPRRLGPWPVPPDERIRVLVIGAIGKIKGFDVLRQLAEHVRQHNMPIDLSLLGYSMDDGQLAAAGVHLVGRYFDHELPAKIESQQPHLIFIPSIWPETYCYALSAALGSGHRVAVFDIGAQAERTRAHDPHHLRIPLDLADEPDALADELLRYAHTADLAYS